MVALIDLKRKTKQGALSIRSYGEYDCENFRYRRLTVGHYVKSMAQEGAVVFADNSPEQWRDVPNGTMRAEALRLACKDH